MLRFLSIVFDLERTNQLNLLPDKDLVDLCHPIEPYQVTKNQIVKILVDTEALSKCRAFVPLAKLPNR
ncbi:hypothetical protein [Microcystis sp. M_OC_Ca_00000000_S217Cul]|uniref:hypothetical protein n=1 Tax=Microcystis sp. M_OC_Ca_00000000_S217Cul TaxID=2486214 RepID=UPI000315C10D|nr:hypothetical protein [Microcystis sp. M_OC_Ca_00000000_S217Cul]